MRRAALSAFVLGVSLLLPLSARADAPEEERETRWYGWQILLADLASVGAVVVTPATEGKSLYLGAGGFALGGPIVHVAHGRPAIGAASLGLRLGVPLLAAAAGLYVGGETAVKCTPSAADGGCDDVFGAAGAALAGGFLGLLGGMVAASAIDIGLLAHEPVERTTPPVSVGVAPTKGGAAFSASFVW